MSKPTDYERGREDMRDECSSLLGKMAEKCKAEQVRLNGRQCHSYAWDEGNKAIGLELGRDAVRGIR